jgi:hypothetical protein
MRAIRRGFAAYFVSRKNVSGLAFPTLKRGANGRCAYGAGSRGFAAHFVSEKNGGIGCDTAKAEP